MAWPLRAALPDLLFWLSLGQHQQKPQSSKAEARRPQLFTLWTGSPLAASPSSAGAAPLLPLAEPVNSWSM